MIIIIIIKLLFEICQHIVCEWSVAVVVSGSFTDVTQNEGWLDTSSKEAGQAPLGYCKKFGREISDDANCALVF